MQLTAYSSPSDQRTRTYALPVKSDQTATFWFPSTSFIQVVQYAQQANKTSNADTLTKGNCEVTEGNYLPPGVYLSSARRRAATQKLFK